MSRIEINHDLVRQTLREGVREAVYSKAAVVKKEDIINRLLQIGTEQREKIILGLMGMDNSWGRIELYKTNGHVTQMQKWLNEEIGVELEKFVKDEARKVFDKETPKIRNAIKECIAREARSMVSSYQIERQMRELISSYISNCGKDILEEVIKEVLPAGITEEKTNDAV